MNKTIDALVDFFDIGKDLESVQFQDQLDYRLTATRLSNVALKNLASLLSPIPKHVMRGAVVGALNGAVLGTFDNDLTLTRYTVAGALLGISVDGIQYLARAGYKYIQTQIYSEQE